MKRPVLLFWILMIILSPWSLQIPKLLKSSPVSIDPVLSLSEPEVSEINKLQGLHIKNIAYRLSGKASWNKPVFVLEKFLDNWFLLLDPNFYFFREHPRERAGTKTVEKMLSSSLLVFLLGLGLMRKNRGQAVLWLGTGLALSVSLAILGSVDNLASWLMLPWLGFPIALGLAWLWQKKRKIFYLFIIIYLFQLTYWWVNFNA